MGRRTNLRAALDMRENKCYHRGLEALKEKGFRCKEDDGALRGIIAIKA